MQCIPLEFFNDNRVNPDCIDRTDESTWIDYVNLFDVPSQNDPSFRCEEHSCSSELSHDFVCGDGECNLENATMVVEIFLY